MGIKILWVSSCSLVSSLQLLLDEEKVWTNSVSREMSLSNCSHRYCKSIIGHWVWKDTCLDLTLIVFWRLITRGFLGLWRFGVFAFLLSFMKYHLKYKKSRVFIKTALLKYLTLLTFELNSFTVLLSSLFCCWRLLKVKSIISKIWTQLFLFFASKEPSILSPS